MPHEIKLCVSYATDGNLLNVVYSGVKSVEGPTLQQNEVVMKSSIKI